MTIWVLGGYQSDFGRNLSKEDLGVDALVAEVVHGTLDAADIAPHDIAGSPLPHTAHRLVRDLGVSTIREYAHRAEALLATPIDELF